jgi:NAD dependent epimerase/dehydratase family enzyme
MSWIHRDDIARLFIHAARNPAASGPLNGTAPNPVRNREFAKVLGRAVRRPAVLPTPRLALRIALGEFADVLATGQRVIPRKTLETGFEFRFVDLEPALQDILANREPSAAMAQ